MTVETGTFEHRGHEHAYEIHGEGDQLFVYLHGLLMDRQMNRTLAQTCADHGSRVALVDFLGHGESDKPLHAGQYRMDAYADDVLAFLDHLDADQAVVGGVSLGADVGLHLAVRAPERIRGLVIEMPVLEWAVPAAALLFTPMLLTMHYAARPAGWAMRQVARIPRTDHDTLNSVLALGSSSPEVVKAVLHGVLTGPVAPTVEQRQTLETPTLVIAHTRDLIHPFSDAESLANMLPNAALAPARSMLELRLRPARLTSQIIEFIDDVWAGTPIESAG